MLAFSTAYLDIIYEEDSHQLIGRWKRGVMPFELQQGYANMLEVAAEKNCRFWLLDIRRRTGADAADMFWLVEEFLPRLLPRLGRPTYLALLMVPHHLAGTLAGPVATLRLAATEPPYRLQRFTEEPAALAWLEYQLQRDSVEK